MLNKEFSPYDYPINLEDQLYRYGARINPNIVLDMRCGGLKVKVGMLGNQPQFDTRPWIYYPIAPGRETHPIVKNLGAVWFRFPGSIDTIKTKTPVKKTVLLTSSPTTRMQAVPTILSLNNIRELSNPMFFNKAPQPLAVLLEGVFPSLYENRVSPEMQATLQQLGQPFRNSSVATKMLVVSDGDVARNQLTNKEGGYMPLGFSRDDGQLYANKDFLLNAVEYMLDEDGVIEARNKEVKLRMLDRVRAKAEKTKWQLINTVLPLIVLVAFGLGFTFLRRRKYAK
jgi:gliding-associated putative ABC transporter substrate-binding component GldG